MPDPKDGRQRRRSINGGNSQGQINEVLGVWGSADEDPVSLWAGLLVLVSSVASQRLAATLVAHASPRGQGVYQDV